MKRLLCFATILLVLHPSLRAQGPDDHSLSNAEIEQLREAADAPRDRVLVFVQFLDDRAEAIHKLFTQPRYPGREQDAHDLYQQFASIANELDDNLDDYAARHSDIRKSLPKLLKAIDKWNSTLKSPPDNEAYNVSRKLALQAVEDVRQDATDMVASQKAWFATHPPSKNSPIEIPR
ncbi:MAG TPA: hypothetical protein VFE38_13565 [Edaphobacter sp.]|nr:hypothetical protein [Edaphobacter sp.]